MTIVFFTLGRDLDMYVQVYLSILSFKKQLESSDRIVIITTNPEYFNHLGYVETVTIDNNTIDEWKGKHGFFWRTKIKAIEKASLLFPDDDLLYLDCDTFLYGDLSALKRQLESGKGFMDGNEGHPSKIKYKPRRMYRTVGGKTYAGITVSEKHDMWCAGVIAIPSAKKEIVIETALSLCDGMLDDNAEPIVIEQYAFSIVMQEKLELMSSKNIIAHYWANKQQWLGIMKDIILKSYFTELSPEEEALLLESVNFKKTPIYVRKHTTNKKLKNLVDILFADGEKRYIEQ